MPRLHSVLAAGLLLLLAPALTALAPAPPGVVPAKLVKKYGKRQAAVQSALVDRFDAQDDLFVAQLDLADLQQADPPPTKKQLKKAKKGVKKATKTLAKADKKLSKSQKKLAKVVAKIEAIDPDWFDTADPAAGVVDVPVLVQEATPAGVSGVDRPDGVATFGLPLAETVVPSAGGVPALAVTGADTWQFRTLDTWPDGSARWVLCDVALPTTADTVHEGLRIVPGAGDSGQTPIGMRSKTRILLDTGPLQALVRTDDFNLLYSVTVDGVLVVHEKELPGVIGYGLGGQTLSPGKDTEVVLEENGPARAVVRAEGSLRGPLGKEHVDFTCRITARRGSRDLEVTFTVRNATIARPEHVVVDSIGLVTRVRGASAPTVELATYDGSLQATLGPDAGSRAQLYQAYSDARTNGLGSAQYLPHLPTMPGDPSSFVQEGYRVSVDGQVVEGLGDASVYPEHGWIDVTGAQGGVTAGIRHMAYLWPASLEAWGDGTVGVGLFPAESPADYTFVWRQHESRTAVFSFHAGPSDDPSLAARRLDVPLTGRAADYDHYDRAGVFAYDLLTDAEHAETLAAMGIDHAPAPDNPPLGITRYLYKGTTGGSNNHAGIEVALGGDWLRYGTGGDYLAGLELALYKSEWQVPRSDDFRHEDDPGAQNDEVPHSTGHFGDDEHRYREGMVLAYHLTGDPRFRDALLDEAEVLPDVSVWPHERSMYQTLRALAHLAEFTGDPALTKELRSRLGYITSPILDVDTATAGFGWEAAPGQGARGYFVNSSDNKDEKPEGESFQARGFISASLGPLGYWHAARVLPDGDPVGVAAAGRMLDLSRWTRKELFPTLPDPVDQRLVYSYAVSLQEVTTWENTDFHPILLGMAESWRATGDLGFLDKGVEQLRAAWLHGDLDRWDTRLDVQHFLAAWREAHGMP